MENRAALPATCFRSSALGLAVPFVWRRGARLGDCRQRLARVRVQHDPPVRGLQRIPRELHEAADSRGRRRVHRFRLVILPQIAPVIALNLALITIATLNTFDWLLPLTAAAPPLDESSRSTCTGRRSSTSRPDARRRWRRSCCCSISASPCSRHGSFEEGASCDAGRRRNGCWRFSRCVSGVSCSRSSGSCRSRSRRALECTIPAASRVAGQLARQLRVRVRAHTGALVLVEQRSLAMLATLVTVLVGIPAAYVLSRNALAARPGADRAASRADGVADRAARAAVRARGGPGTARPARRPRAGLRRDAVALHIVVSRLLRCAAALVVRGRPARRRVAVADASPHRLPLIGPGLASVAIFNLARTGPSSGWRSCCSIRSSASPCPSGSSVSRAATRRSGSSLPQRASSDCCPSWRRSCCCSASSLPVSRRAPPKVSSEEDCHANARGRVGTTQVHVIAHTHWDREWYLTREQYRARLVDLIDRVLERMSAEPEFTFFHLDGQTIVIETTSRSVPSGGRASPSSRRGPAARRRGT